MHATSLCYRSAAAAARCIGFVNARAWMRTAHSRPLSCCARQPASIITLPTRSPRAHAHICAVSLFSRPCSTTAATPSLTDAHIQQALDSLDIDSDASVRIILHASTLCTPRAINSGVSPTLARAWCVAGVWHLHGTHGCSQRGDHAVALTLLHGAAVCGDGDAAFALGDFFSRVEAFTPTPAPSVACNTVIEGGDEGGKGEETVPVSRLSPSTPLPALYSNIPVSEPVVAAGGEVVTSEERGRAVMRDILRMRKIAKANKARKVTGLPLIPLTAPSVEAYLRAEASVAATGPAYEAEDVSKVPLVTDVNRARFWLEHAASKDHADAQVALGNLFMRQYNQTRAAADVHRAKGWYETAACLSEDAPAHASPHTDALYNLGMMYFDGVGDVVPRDRPLAARLLFQAADLMDPSALFWCGQALHNGMLEAGIRPNGSRARRFIELAAGCGHARACHYLASLYRTGDAKLGLRVDETRVRYFLTRAASAGDADAAFDIADAYMHGHDGFTQNAAQALTWYGAAGAAGHAQALVCAGVLHYTGNGTPKNAAAAFALYTAAGERGSIDGWMNVAAMYARGDGVPKNLDAARHVHKHIIPMLQRAQEADARAAEEAKASALPDAASACCQGKKDCSGPQQHTTGCSS